MEAILKFSLPEEEEEHLSAVNGMKWKLVAWDVDQWLRGQIKYSPETQKVDAISLMEEIRQKLHEVIGSYDISLD